MQFETILRGVHFRPLSAKEVVNHLQEGDILSLEREPGNPHDENAIRVMEPESGEFLGYVAKENAAEIAPIMDSGTRFGVIVTGFMRPGMPILQIDAADTMPPHLGDETA